jgi:large subunit ribosomal protein L1
MSKHSKRYNDLRQKVEKRKQYPSADATALVKELATAKFDETVEAHFKLGVDPRKSDQNVRGTVALPHGTGRTVRVLAITQGDNVQVAQDAGADFVGGEDMVDRILEGWFDYDTVVATPDMMALVGSKLGRILGPRGMLPNPKAGTVGPNIADMVSALKAGQIEFRNDKTGALHAPLAKLVFLPNNSAKTLPPCVRLLKMLSLVPPKGFLSAAFISPRLWGRAYKSPLKFQHPGAKHLVGVGDSRDSQV